MNWRNWQAIYLIEVNFFCTVNATAEMFWNAGICLGSVKLPLVIIGFGI